MNILKSIGCEGFVLIFIPLKLWEILLCFLLPFSPISKAFALLSTVEISARGLARNGPVSTELKGMEEKGDLPL